MNVLLINPPNVFFESKTRMMPKKVLSRYPPAGLMFLAAILQKEKIEVSIMDVIAEGQTIAEINDFIKRESVKIIGITSTTPQIRGAVQLAKSIKEEFGERVKIVLGGPHISLVPDFISKFTMFDAGIVGEGEYVFLDLVKKVLEGKDIAGIHRAERIIDLDSIPFQDRDLINQDAYYIEPFGSKCATIHTMRGCPFNCAFCSNAIVGRKVVYRSAENVLEEIEECVKKRGTKIILFTDDTFTLDVNRAVAICDGIIKRKLKVKWICATRANLVNKELLFKMRVAGCVEIQFGVETGSEKLRNEVIHKNITDEALVNAFKLCRKLGLETDSFCMLGFPRETKEDMLKTLELNLKLKPDILGLHLTILYPSTQLHKWGLEEGKIDADYWNRFALGEINEEAVYIPDGFSLEELRDMQQYVYKKYYFRPAYFWQRLCRDLRYSKRIKSDLHIGLQLFLKGSASTSRP